MNDNFVQNYERAIQNGECLPIVDGDDYEIWLGKDLIRYCEMIDDPTPVTKSGDLIDRDKVYKMMCDEEASIYEIPNSKDVVLSIAACLVDSHVAVVYEAALYKTHLITQGEAKLIVGYLTNLKKV